MSKFNFDKTFKYKEGILCLLTVLCGLLLIMGKGMAAQVPVLCYHSVNQQGDMYNVTPERLREHLQYFQKQGYHLVTPEQLKFAANGAQLPSKPLLLSFDDGYVSFYTEVFPLLKQFNVPATMFIITSWPDTPATGLTWQQLIEMDKSGLVTVGSHSHTLHRYAPINKYGDEGPVTETPPYEGKYLTATAYELLLQKDLMDSRNVLAEKLGHESDILAWPYGAYNGLGQIAAKKSGFREIFVLDDRPNEMENNNLQELRRLIVTNNPTAEELAGLLEQARQQEPPHRIVQMDLDAVYDKNAAQLEQNLQKFLARLQRTGADTVYLQAFNDAQGNGNTKSVYFHTTAAPETGDIFSHVVTKIKNSGRYRVYAWTPTLSAQWASGKRSDGDVETVQAYKSKNGGWYRRATPFDKRTGKRLSAAFRDLAFYNPIDGILFQDDMYLNDFEDFSAAGKRAYKQKFGQELTPELVKDPASPVFNAWTDWKTTQLTKLSQDLAAAVHAYRPQAKMARNIYALAIIDKGAQDWLCENYRQYLDTYDYVVAMAYPYMENPDFKGDNQKAAQWLKDFSHKAFIDLTPTEKQKLVFKLQTYEWAQKTKVPAQVLQDQANLLYQQGARNVAFYPEIDFTIPVKK